MNGKGEELSAGMERTLAILQLMFILRGIPFVDLAYLRKSDIQGNILRYRRRKTGRRLTVILTPEALKLIDTLSDKKGGIALSAAVPHQSGRERGGLP